MPSRSRGWSFHPPSYRPVLSTRITGTAFYSSTCICITLFVSTVRPHSCYSMKLTVDTYGKSRTGLALDSLSRLARELSLSLSRLRKQFLEVFEAIHPHQNCQPYPLRYFFHMAPTEKKAKTSRSVSCKLALCMSYMADLLRPSTMS